MARPQNQEFAASAPCAIRCNRRYACPCRGGRLAFFFALVLAGPYNLAASAAAPPTTGAAAVSAAKPRRGKTAAASAWPEGRVSLGDGLVVCDRGGGAGPRRDGDGVGKAAASCGAPTAAGSDRPRSILVLEEKPVGRHPGRSGRSIERKGDRTGSGRAAHAVKRYALSPVSTDEIVARLCQGLREKAAGG